MSTRANPIVIGAFVVGAVALLLVALLVWGGTGLFRTKLDYVLFFDSAVTGLNKGAPVLGRGVKVGEVTDIQVRWGTQGLVAVYITLEPDAMKGIGRGRTQAGDRARGARADGLRAQLRMQSFVTGVLYVALDRRPGTPIVLRGLDPKVPELPTIPADLEVWMAKLERFADRIEKIPLEQHWPDGGRDSSRKSRRSSQSKDTHDLIPERQRRDCGRSDTRPAGGRPDRPDCSPSSTATLTRLAAALDAGPTAGHRRGWPGRPARRPRQTPRSRRRRGRSATSGRSSRTCAASRPSSMPRRIRC